MLCEPVNQDDWFAGSMPAHAAPAEIRMTFRTVGDGGITAHWYLCKQHYAVILTQLTLDALTRDIDEGAVPEFVSFEGWDPEWDPATGTYPR